MRKGAWVFAFVILLIVSSIAVIGSVQEKPLSQFEKADAETIKSLESEHEVSVIVVLKPDPKTALDPGIQGRKLFGAKSRVKAKSNKELGSEVLDTLNPSEFRKEYQYESFSGFSGSVTATGLRKLENDPRVAKIEKVRPVYATLAQSRPGINATRVLNAYYNSTLINGSGETVCVIDTGVDYTHADLGGCTNDSFLNGTCAKVIGGYDYVNADTDPIDDHGHGTHVAGIVAAGGTTNGVAPGARIVALKMLNSAGSGNTSSLNSAIDWCVSNRTTYNISVITMSLGDGGQYDSTEVGGDNCDGSTTAISIDAAYAAGIVVVAASGNDGYSNGIGSPACITNALSVGATYDGGSITKSYSCSDASTVADTVACFTNVDEILDVMAPGIEIVSTWLGGGTFATGGTSMAAPHVAGASALLIQAKKLENGSTLTPAEVLSTLTSTGKNVTHDSVITPRIDVYAAINSLDSTAPNITIAGPANNTFYSIGLTSVEVNLTTTENATCKYSSTNASFAFTTGTSFSSTGGITHSTNISGAGAWILYHKCNDTAGNVNSNSVMHNFTLDTITVTLNSPSNNTITQNTSAILNCSAVASLNISTSTYNLTNGTLYSNFSGTWGINGTSSISGTSNETTFNETLSEGSHVWNCQVNNTNNNSALASANYTLTVDLTAPIVTLNTPANIYNTSSENVTFNCSATDSVLLGNITLYHNGSGTWNGTNTSTIGGTSNESTYTETFSEGAYVWNCQANDTVLNANFSASNQSFTVDLTNPNLFTINATPNRVNRSENINFTANVSDNYGIRNVTVNITTASTVFELSNDGSGIYSYLWNTTNASTRVHNYTITVTDIADRTNASTGTLRVAEQIYTNTKNIPANNTTTVISVANVLIIRLLTASTSNSTETIMEQFTTDPFGTSGVSGKNSTQRYYNVTSNVTNLSVAPVDFYYNATYLNENNLNESAVEAYRYNGTTWNQVSNSSNTERNTSASYVRVNLTSFSLYTLFTEANQTATPDPVITATAPASSGGGGGGGGGSGASLPQEIVAFGVVGPGETKTKRFTKANDHFVQQISITAVNEIKNGNVRVIKYNARPATVEKTPEDAFMYLAIDGINFEAADVSDVTIQIKVNKSWFTENNKDANQGTLWRRVGGDWVALETEKDRLVGANHYFYNAKSPGFSMFAITAKDKPVKEIVEVIEEPVEEMINETNTTTEDSVLFKKTRRTLITIALGVTISILLFLFLWERKEVSREIQETALEQQQLK